MHIIKWGKYLSNKRYRNSQFEAKSSDAEDRRNSFESDFGRVIFSSALRRMHDKTQVVPLTNGDNIHTRLPHSLEVMSLAYSLGVNYCRHPEVIADYTPEELHEMETSIPIILKTAACVHDIGNPPFGHFGETVIKNWFNNRFSNDHMLPVDQELDFIEFDGNAQGFRILNKIQYLGDLSGLNLTYATLAAYLKYPNKDKRIKGGYIGQKKHGIFHSEVGVFDDIVKECGLRKDDGSIKRHPLAFLTEAADTICYAVMDIEDGFSMGCFKYNNLIEELDKIIAGLLLAKNEDETKDLKFFNHSAQNKFSIRELLGLSDEKDNCFGEKQHKPDRVKITDLRVKLFAYLVKTVGDEFISNLKEIDEGSYSQELTDADPYCICKALTQYAGKNIFSLREIERVELTGHAVISGLLDIMTTYALMDDEQYRRRLKSVLSKTILKVSIHEKILNEHPEKSEKESTYYISDDYVRRFDLMELSPYQKFRLIVDNISGMTDSYAVSLFRELSGSKL